MVRARRRSAVPGHGSPSPAKPVGLKELVGAGDRILLVTVPFVILGLALNIAFPAVFEVGGPPAALRAISIVLLILGIVIWLWSVVLVLTRVPRRELITSGPFAVVRHPIFTSVSLLVIPALGVLLNSWLGLVVGIVMYVSARIFGREEEAVLARTFGSAWDEYRASVKIPWL